MNNPLRRMHLRFIELRAFQKLLNRHNITLQGKILLDAACGSGYSLRLLQKTFKPKNLIGFDFMPAQARLARRFKGQASYFLGDATQLPLVDELFDGLFAFGMLHHVENWQGAVQEFYRVLSPGGYLLVEEPSRSVVNFFGTYFGFEFPVQGQFEWHEFENVLEKSGFKKIACKNLYCSCLRFYLFQKPLAK